MLKISGSPNFLHADLFVGLMNSGQGVVRHMALDGVNQRSVSFRFSILPIVYTGKTFHTHSGIGCDATRGRGGSELSFSGQCRKILNPTTFSIKLIYLMRFCTKNSGNRPFL